MVQQFKFATCFNAKYVLDNKIGLGQHKINRSGGVIPNIEVLIIRQTSQFYKIPKSKYL